MLLEKNVFFVVLGVLAVYRYQNGVQHVFLTPGYTKFGVFLVYEGLVLMILKKVTNYCDRKCIPSGASQVEPVYLYRIVS